MKVVPHSPYTLSPGNTQYDYTTFQFDVTGLPLKLWKSKLQFDVTISIGNLILLNSGLKEVTNETWNHVACRKRNEVLAKVTPDGSLQLEICMKIEHQTQQIDAFKDIATYHSRMLSNKVFWDFKFVVKGKEFKVHRAILSSVSPVFEKMFTTDMKEGSEKLCHVKDFEPEIFEHLLRFIYGGELPDDIGGVAMKLYDAAHYYDIEQLKLICLRELPLALEEVNALDMFNWACIYDLEELKVLAWAIIKR